MEDSCPFGGRNFSQHIVLSQVDIVVVRFSDFCLVRKPAGSFSFFEIHFTRHGQDRKLAIIPNPGRRLVGLFEAHNFIGAVLVLPAFTVGVGLGRPKIHPPGNSNGRIGIPTGEGPFGISPHQWVDHFLGLKCGLGKSGEAQATEYQEPDGKACAGD